MKFKTSLISFLKGDEFSNGLEIKVAQKELSVPGRLETLENLSSGKKIIHLGCCDHIPLIEDKIKKNNWLHARIDNVAEECLGIDINIEGIKYLKDNLQYKNVIHANIAEDEVFEIKSKKWEYLILGEILEHINNPLLFLKQINDKYKNYIEKIVLTVPNAFAYDNFKFAKKNLEIINTDHRYWFTPYTLAKILVQAGYKIDDFGFVQEISNKTGLKAKLFVWPFLKKKIFYKRLRISPALRDTIIMTAYLNE